jgi:DNA-binding LacI/PurR family transcriptional regulator
LVAITPLMPQTVRSARGRAARVLEALASAKHRGYNGIGYGRSAVLKALSWGPTMGASIEDVAQRAGVSIATVSRALRGLPNVSVATRQRVLDAAAELRYCASPHAVGLASGKTRTIAVVMPFLSRWAFGQALGGIESVLSASGYDLLLYRVGDAATRSRFIERKPLRRRVDGIIAVYLPLTDEGVDILADVPVPVVLLGTSSDVRPSVCIDDAGGASAAVQHLVNLGHRRIALIGGDEDTAQFAVPQNRREGYRRSLVSNGVELDEALEVPGNFTAAGGAAAMAVLLGRADPPTAVFAESDEMAMGAMRTVGSAGLRVPDDVSIVGFDDHELAPLFDLTTVAQDVVDQGIVAATLLLDIVEDGRPQEQPQGEPPRVALPTRLVIRRSTGRPAPGHERRLRATSRRRSP